MRPTETARRQVLGAFAAHDPGLMTAPMVAPAHAAVAFVWMVDDRFVLRARDAATPDAVAAFEAEQELLDRARALLPYPLPAPLTTPDGTRYVLAEGLLWTLHEALPGHILCPWQAHHTLDAPAARRLVRLLRDLHVRTRGRLGEGDPGWIVRRTRDHVETLADILPPEVRSRVQRSLVRVIGAVLSLEPDALTFVHGDFHFGNLLLATPDPQAPPSGLLDLDWARVAHPLEDLGYTAMMLIRAGVTGDDRRHRLDRLDTLYEWYGFDGPRAEGHTLFREYVLLYALFDVALFQQAVNLEDRDRHIENQIALLSELARFM